ncbi:MAG: helix-turn-helix domain-containing protein [Bordetella sp.]|nr:helix-turn-helix domain-containing protein [Bordetella sp.]
MAGERAPEAPFPVFESTDFSGEGDFYFDLVRLESRDDIPRGFPHRHNYYHLLWMSRARGTHLLDFQPYEVRDHAVFFLSPGQLHAWTSSVRPAGYVLNISTAFFARMFPRADDIAKFPFFHLTGGTPVLYLSRAQHDALVPLLRAIEHELLERQVGRFDIVRSYLLILLTQLRRLHPAEDAHPPGQGLALVKRLGLLIEAHYLEFDSVGRYAETLCVSERQLNEAVRRITGMGASQLIQQRIALEAKRLLCNTALQVAEIAFRLNFDDPAYFARFFKKHTGSTAGEFRRRYHRPLD